MADYPVIPQAIVPTYQILVRDKAGNLLGEINDWHNLSFSDRLNNYGICQFEIPARSPDLINSISLRRYEVLVLRDGQVVWSGEQAQRSVKLEANSPQMVTITAYTFVEQLLHMVTPEYVRFEQIDQGLILKALVDYYQSLPGGNFGFTFDTIVPTKSRDQEYSNYEILNAFINMSNRISGIDFWIDEDKVIHIVPLRGTDLSKQVILEYGTNFLNVQIDEDFSTPANEAIVLGAGFGAEQKKGGFLDTAARDIYGLRQRVVSEIDVSEIETLNDKGEAFVSKYKTALRSIQGVQIPKTQPEFGSFHIGDSIGQKVKEGTYNIDAKFRVYGYEVKVGPGGEENVSYLTAQPEVLG